MIALALLAALAALYPAESGAALPVPSAVATLAARVASGAEDRARLGEVELVGPLSDVVLDLGPAGETRLEGALFPGELRRVTVPLPARDRATPPAPLVRWQAVDDPSGRGGSARFLGWREPETDPYAAVAPGLRVRPRPPAERTASRAPAGLALALAAALAAGLGWRRRPALAAAAALAGVALVAALAPRPAGPARWRLALLEGDLASERWLAIEAAVDRLAVAPEAGDLRVEARGARIWRVRTTTPGERVARAAGNALGEDLAEAWVRDGGAWTARGTWAAGEPLPAPRPGPDPPGWLASGLPHGTGVLLGRLAGSSPSWVRISGFEAPREPKSD